MERIRSVSLRGTEHLRGCGDESRRGQTEISGVGRMKRSEVAGRRWWRWRWIESRRMEELD